MEFPELKLGVYRHYKGNIYKVLGIAKHSETLEELVVYQDMNDTKKIWVRPLAMFKEDVVVNGNRIPRFAFISEN